MLQIKKISKKYKTGGFVQKALDNVSLNLRDNEFVAILGPSGSGKTTLLNIIGGLDRYDSGDLIINNVSTKKYKDKDWDTYRNHTIGFVFQSYNLIPHQTVLSNVELALKISETKPSKRRKMAIDALDKVGLKKQINKKPNQLSGGQMQRVAIARALVNNPDIVLADEPTGALDSETSRQVMDLLKEVAKDRLVVMVTHNPELAKQYATRIVKIKDGKLIEDSNPYRVNKYKDEEIKHKRIGKASMSFPTALGLSLKNLISKKARTLMVSFAGSIGIIGIALILSLSSGVNQYIKSTEESTLSEYPIDISDSSVSMSSMLGASSSLGTSMMQSAQSGSGEIKELDLLENLLSVFDRNDLSSFRDYLKNECPNIYDYAKAIEYNYNIEPQVYLKYKGQYRKVNPNESFDSMGISSTSFIAQNLTMMNVFYKLPSEDDLYKDEYNVKCGKWPENENECVIVTTEDGGISDFIIYTLGLRDSDEMADYITKIAEGKSVKLEKDKRDWNYSDFLNISFKVLCGYEKYSFDSKKNIYIDKSKDEDFMDNAISNGKDLKIVGIVSPKSNATSLMLNPGINYSSKLIDSIRDDSKDSDIVKAQIATPDINVLTGEAFGSEDKEDSFDFASLFTIDTNELKKAFKIDQNKITIDTSAFTENNDLEKYLSNFSGINIDTDELINAIEKTGNDLMTSYLKYSAKDKSTDYSKLPNSLEQYINSDEGKKNLAKIMTKFMKENGSTSISNDDITNVVQDVMSGYLAYCKEKNYSDIENIRTHMNEYLATSEAQKLIDSETEKLITKVISNMNLTNEQITELAKEIADGYDSYAGKNDLPQLSKLESSFKEFIKTKEARQIISDDLSESVHAEEVKNALTKTIGQYLASKMSIVMKKAMMSLPNAFTIDQNAFKNAFQINMSEDEIKSLISAMLSNNESSYESNLNSFGYASEDDINELLIYPKDFDSKNSIIDIIKTYNQKVEDNGEKDKVISYNDYVGTMMASVTQIVNVVSYVLIAFTAISLIVSSIMISVITYISVLERRKEIGILRALGASKHNITEVFNSETLIIGFFSGIIGVEISRLLIIPINFLIHKLTGVTTISAFLPVSSGTVLVLLSIILTLIAGLVPAHRAAKSDPVTALRTE